MPFEAGDPADPRLVWRNLDPATEHQFADLGIAAAGPKLDWRGQREEFLLRLRRRDPQQEGKDSEEHRAQACHSSGCIAASPMRKGGSRLFIPA